MASSTANSKIKVLVVGGGIAGLATAYSIARQRPDFEVIVLERQDTLTEVGAGIQISASAAKILCKWGLRSEFESIATFPDCSELRRYSNGKLLGKIWHNYHDFSENMYGAPHWLLHRADFQLALAKAAGGAGVEILLDRRIERVDCDVPQVVFKTGSVMAADLIIGADGIWSKTRTSIPENSQVKPAKAGEFCYRFLVPRERMLSHPDARPLIEDPHLSLAYAGPNQGLVCYPISNGRLYNMATTVVLESDAPLGAYNEPGDVEEMRRQFSGFDKHIRGVMALAETCAKWNLIELPPLPAWSSQNGRVMLVGDAAHAMLPYTGAGGTVSIEDAGVIGELLAPCKTADNIPAAVQAFETLRRARCERVQEISRQNRGLLAMVDGTDQEARDTTMAAATTLLEKRIAGGEILAQKPKPEMNAPYPSPASTMWLYGYDGIQEAQDYLARSK